MAAGDISLNRGGLFKFGNFENRKGAAKPRPLCTPLGLFLSSARDSLFLFVDLCLYASVFSALRCADVVLFLHFLCGSLLEGVCILRYSAHYAVPMLFYFFTFSVIHFRQDACMLRYSAHYAVPMLFYFFTFSVTHFWQGVCILRYSVRYAMPMLFYFFTFSVILFRQGVCILRYSARYAMPILFHFFTFSVIHFWQGVCILRYSMRYALRSLALNLRRGEAGCWW